MKKNNREERFLRVGSANYPYGGQAAEWEDQESGELFLADTNVNPNGTEKEEPAHANARLIAAAPEMLEACQEALRDLLYMGANLQSIKLLELAIKKALGE